MPTKIKKTILIVEDEVSLRSALSDKFSREGFSVLEARDGEVGLDIAIKKEPEIILLDVIMPKMDGMTMLKNLREKGGWGRNVPIILLSNLGADDEKMMKEISNDKLAFYLVKSDWSLNDIVKQVKDKISVL
jgi:DNA-binding response OmpR family regulator